MDIESVIQKLVTDDDDINFLIISTADEIRDAVFSMDTHSASDSIGFSGFFFRHCWDIV